MRGCAIVQLHPPTPYRCTRRDRGDADSCEHLFDQSVAIVQRLHHQALFSGHLSQNRRGKKTQKVKVETGETESRVQEVDGSQVGRGAPRSAEGSSAELFSRRTTAPWSSSAEAEQVEGVALLCVSLVERNGTPNGL